jgi:DNA anti-recombination protein RmuC
MTDEPRLSRIENAIEKLTTISADLNKLIAVHEQRLVHNEREISDIYNAHEKASMAFERRVHEMYEHVTKEDDKVINKLQAFEDKFTGRLAELERNMWKLTGAITLIGFAIAYGPHILRLFFKVG